MSHTRSRTDTGNKYNSLILHYDDHIDNHNINYLILLMVIINY